MAKAENVWNLLAQEPDHGCRHAETARAMVAAQSVVKSCKGGTNHRESVDCYRGEILRAGRWRVVVCKDHIQWILQKRTGAGNPDGGRWEGKHYLTTRDSVLHLWRSSTGLDGAALLQLLPERIKRRQKT